MSLVVTGANEHAVTQLDQLLEAIMVEREPERSAIALNHIAAATIAFL